MEELLSIKLVRSASFMMIVIIVIIVVIVIMMKSVASIMIE